jgi:hypothetical protein
MCSQSDLLRAEHLASILRLMPGATPHIRAGWAAELAEIAGRVRDAERRRAGREGDDSARGVGGGAVGEFLDRQGFPTEGK